MQALAIGANQFKNVIEKNNIYKSNELIPLSNTFTRHR